MNSSACINYSKEKWPETIPSTRSCMDSLRKEAIQLVEVFNIKEIKSGFILHVIGYEWISSEEMCNYQGFVKNSSIDQLYHYRAALGPTCHSKSGRKEEQERERGKRERKERCWSQRSGIINGDFWEFVELSMMSWHGDQDQIIVTQSFLHCHSQWKRPKKIKNEGRKSLMGCQ